MPSRRRLRVKFILPALTEATSPYWRPIKYSLFPPLGLATLAAYLRPDDDAVIVDEHVGAAADRTTAPTWSRFRSTSPTRSAPMPWPIATARRVSSSSSAACT